MQFEETWKDKNKYHITLLMCAVQKTGTDERICKAEIKTQTYKHMDTRKQMYGHQERKWGGINWVTEIDIYTLLCIKEITNENLL